MVNGNKQQWPLFVDLDGTLIFSDLLVESSLKFLKQTPFGFIYLLIWLFKGKAYLKSQLASHVDLEIESLPYNEDFIAFLRDENRQGRRIYLATASIAKYADQIAEHLAIFDGVIATSASSNLKGIAKLEKCREISPDFAYAGNETIDFTIFEHAKQSYLVNPTAKALARTKVTPVDRVWLVEKNPLKVVLKGLRVHQWLKNLLIFVPLLVSGLFTDIQAIGYSILGFLLFSLLASATYVLNDLSDLEADRVHPRKKNRPIPSGIWPLHNAIFMAVGLFFLVVISSILLTPLNFQVAMLAYLLLTLAYTFYFKDYVIADVISLASLFTIRIIAGTMILNVELSFWLLAFSMFTFFSLALVKRCAELKLLSQMNKTKSSGRDYYVDDYNLMQSFGVTSAFISLLIMSFYVQASLHDGFYQTPILLWATLPAFAYWLCRMWLKTNRGEMHDDPIVFSIKDKGSIITIAFIILITLAAKF